MSEQLFNELCDAIDNNVMSKHSLKKVIELRENIKFVKDQFVSFCWAIFKASKFDSKKLYNAGLDDTHILTALKRIMSDFK